MNSSAKSHEVVKEMPPRGIVDLKVVDPRLESPMSKRISAFKPYSSTCARNGKDKSPFRQFVADL